MIPVKYWLFLFASIVLEVMGTSVMKMSQNVWPVAGLGVMYLLLALSYFLLARAVLRVPLGVAYAFWEGFGLALITLISVFFIDEQMTPLRFTALIMVLAGTLLVHQGTGHGNGDEAGEPVCARTLRAAEQGGKS